MTDARDLTIGFVGVGHLAEYTLKGLRRGGWRGRLQLGPRNAAKAGELAAACDGTVMDSNRAAADGADLVFLATRPPQALEALAGLTLTADQTLVSVVAGLPLAEVAAGAGAAGRVVRALPVTAAEVCASPTMVHPADPTVEGLFALTGQAVVTEREADFDGGLVLACVYGCFFALFDRLAAQAGARGMDPATARQVALGMAEGAARTGRESDADLMAIARRIGTEGSFTKDVLDHLEDSDAFTPWAEGMGILFDKLKG